MKYCILIILFIHYSYLLCQQSGRIEINNIRLDVASNGSIGMGTNANGMEFPINSGIHALFTGNLWIAGFDSTFGILHASANAYNESLSNFRPGPIASDYSPAYYSKYDRVWKVSKSDIDYHKIHYIDVGYLVPTSIADWPGNGDTGNGESAVLAPFYDKNLNGNYEPSNGDYPLINGDEALYIIYNDEQGVPQKTDGNTFHVEVHVMVYGFDAVTLPHLNNSIFLQYKLINRSSEIYKDVLVGHWNDFDLGCFSNDRVGTDTNLNCIFVYNGSESDNPCNGALGYDNLPVSLGLTYLNRDIFSSSYFTNGAPPHMSEPGNNPMEIYYYMNGFWRDGTPFTEGGNGYGGLIPTRYMFPGEPCDTADATEVFNLPLGDRRALASTGYMTWRPGSQTCIDLAYTFVIGDTLSFCMFDEVTALKSEIQKVKDYYNLNLNYCNDIVSSIKERKDVDPNFDVVYSPINRQIYIKSKGKITPYEIALYDMEGKSVFWSSRETSGHPVDIYELANGFYIAGISISNHTYFHKVVIF